MTRDVPATPRDYGDGLAVVAVTYWPGETLESFCDTLEKATTRDVQVILSDNGSGDGAPERAARRENVRLLPAEGNLGFGKGANRGVHALGEDVGWVLVSNTDITFAEGALDELLAATQRWPRGAAFGPLIREPDGALYPSARELPALGAGVGHAVLGKVWPANPWSKRYRQSHTEVVERAAGWLSGSCTLFRRSAFDAVGGFDPRYFMYFEDVDLGDRLGAAGWLNVYVPSAEVVHIGGHSTARASATMLAAHHDSAYQYLADRHRGPAWAPLRSAIKVGLSARLRIAARSDRPPRA